jgi:hypothetical protein
VGQLGGAALFAQGVIDGAEVVMTAPCAGAGLADFLNWKHLGLTLQKILTVFVFYVLNNTPRSPVHRRLRAPQGGLAVFQ